MTLNESRSPTQLTAPGETVPSLSQGARRSYSSFIANGQENWYRLIKELWAIDEARP